MDTLEQPRGSSPRPSAATARTQLIGSMIRPPEVVEAFRRIFPDRNRLGRFPRGEGSDADRQRFAEVVETALADLVARQRAVGIEVVVNGEFDRFVWWMSLYGALEGFAMDREPLVARDGRGNAQTLHVPRIDRRVRRVANPAAEEAERMARATDGPFKITFPAASRELTFWGRPVLGPEVYDDGAYDDPDQAFAELLAVQRELIDEVVRAGTSFIQLDYPVYTHAADESWRKVFRDGGVDRDTLIERALGIDNAMIDGLPDDVTTGLHFCRGNIGEKYLARGALDEIAERVFGDLRYDLLMVEWTDPERHGGFDALRFVPPGTTVVLGIVDTKSRRVQTEDELLRTVESATRHIDVSQLAISPQCGFSSAVGLNDATDVQWRKIDVMCRAAERIWGRTA